MLSGRRLDLLDPSPLDVEIADIAHGLARVARWNGQTSGAHIFSVAQHCLLVEQLFAAAHPRTSAAERLCVLLHDAAEYVVGDMISPFKSVIGDTYKGVETRVLQAIMRRFSLPDPTPVFARQIKRADRAAACVEATRLAGFAPAEAERLFGHAPAMNEVLLGGLEPTPAGEAQARYLQRFRCLEQERGATDPSRDGEGISGG